MMGKPIHANLTSGLLILKVVKSALRIFLKYSHIIKPKNSRCKTVEDVSQKTLESIWKIFAITLTIAKPGMELT
ncbi:MAG: hypothetical protein MI717_04425 [Spirochaetales bacterium]|nr:hypothetical protein [Spirochaetales bacterium]